MFATDDRRAERSLYLQRCSAMLCAGALALGLAFSRSAWADDTGPTPTDHHVAGLPIPAAPSVKTSPLDGGDGTAPDGGPGAQPPRDMTQPSHVEGPSVADAGARVAPPPTFVVQGVVLSPEHASIVGAPVEALSVDSENFLAHVLTDPSGRFTLSPLPAGTYRIRIGATDYTPTTMTIDVGPETAPLTTTLQPSVIEVVVAGKRPIETGTSASVVSRKDILDLPGGDAQPLNNIVLTQPGFTPDSFGPDGIFHIRGAETGVLYMVDGLQLPAGLAGQFTDVLPTQLVQRVRLVVGGMPVEYGPSAGGVFDIITRHGTNTPEGGAQIVYGTYQKVQPTVWYSQAVGKLDIFASGTYLSTERGLDPPAINPILHDAEQGGNAVTRLDYRPTDHDRIELLARYSEQHFQIPIDPTLLPLGGSTYPDGASRGPDSYGNFPAQFVPYNANPTELERDLIVAAGYTHAFAGASFLISPYIRYFYSNLDCDPLTSLGPTADPGSTCSNIQHDLFHEGFNTTLGWSVGTAQRWKAGIVFDDGQSQANYTQFSRGLGLPVQSPVGGPDPALTIVGQDNTNIVSGGAFVQDEIKIGNLKLMPGLRADFQDAVFEDTTQSNLMLASPSARLGMTYAFTDSLTLHGFAGYLWQPPNAVDSSISARALVPSLAGQTVPVDLKAETDEGGEIGLRYERPGRFDIDLTGYGRLSQNTIDVTNVGATNLIVDYNYIRGRAIGTELSTHAAAKRYLRGFANMSWNIAQGQGIGSEQYLFTAAEVAYPGWQILDHVQEWTVNVGADLHDDAEKSHLDVTYQYASGLRTGPDNNETVPGHSLVNVTLRHRFDLFALHPEVALDVFNLFNEAYALRIGNGFVGSAYGALREVNLRVTVPFGGQPTGNTR